MLTTVLLTFILAILLKVTPIIVVIWLLSSSTSKNSHISSVFEYSHASPRCVVWIDSIWLSNKYYGLNNQILTIAVTIHSLTQKVPRLKNCGFYVEGFRNVYSKDKPDEIDFHFDSEWLFDVESPDSPIITKSEFADFNRTNQGALKVYEASYREMLSWSNRCCREPSLYKMLEPENLFSETHLWWYVNALVWPRESFMNLISDGMNVSRPIFNEFLRKLPILFKPPDDRLGDQQRQIQLAYDSLHQETLAIHLRLVWGCHLMKYYVFGMMMNAFFPCHPTADDFLRNAQLVIDDIPAIRQIVLICSEPDHYTVKEVQKSLREKFPTRIERVLVLRRGWALFDVGTPGEARLLEDITESLIITHSQASLTTAVSTFGHVAVNRRKFRHSYFVQTFSRNFGVFGGRTFLQRAVCLPSVGLILCIEFVRFVLFRRRKAPRTWKAPRRKWGSCFLRSLKLALILFVILYFGPFLLQCLGIVFDVLRKVHWANLFRFVFQYRFDYWTYIENVAGESGRRRGFTMMRGSV